jgi:hypothetical protein
LIGDEWHEVMAVEKGMGLKKGEKVKRLGPIKARGRWERLDTITQEEVILEGFPGMTPREFVKFFCKTHRGCKPETEINRIEFDKIPEEKLCNGKVSKDKNKWPEEFQVQEGFKG